MKARIFKRGDLLEIVMAAGPLAGTLVAFADQVQISDWQANPAPGALMEGNIKACWGLQLVPDLSINHFTVAALGIGKAFRNIPYPKQAKISTGATGPFLSDRTGGRLQISGLLAHLSPNSCLYLTPHRGDEHADWKPARR